MTEPELKSRTEEPAQGELRLALVKGVAVTSLPRDLYIPPDALEVFLDTFEGPLDLLLYLIKRENLDILNIPIAEITRQYIQYVELMKDMRLELAAEYLVMAAMLAEIKSRMLLPRSADAAEDEDDPRAELVRRLQEYERFKQAAEDLDALPQVGRDVYPVVLEFPDRTTRKPLPDVALHEVLGAYREVLERAKMFSHHHIQREPLSVRERMSNVLERLQSDGFVEFVALFDHREGRAGVVVTLLALLELLKNELLELVQAEPYAPIYAKAVDGRPEQEEKLDG